MGDVITRKCDKCKGEIAIDRNNITNVVYFDKKYYHTSCFEDRAKQRSASNRGNPKHWQNALDDLWTLESETKKALEHSFFERDLNDWLLTNYNIATVPTRFWQILSELESGIYKGKRCKPIDAGILYGCWKWGQRKLNEINQYNKYHNKGPANDSARLVYDLTILIDKIPNYLAYKEKQTYAKAEMSRTTINNDDIDMSRVGYSRLTSKKDISDISDDIFTE